MKKNHDKFNWEIGDLKKVNGKKDLPKKQVKK